MANRKFILSSATKRKLDWLKAQWVNEMCRNLQAKVKPKPRLFATTVHFKIFIRIVTAHFSQQDLSLRQPHRFRMSPASNAFNVRTCWKDRNLLVLVEY